MKATIVFFLFVAFSAAAPLLEESGPDLREDFRIELDDSELEDEFRRRMGGPYELDDTFAILNTAIDKITGRNLTRRQFSSQAASLISLLTEDVDSTIEDSAGAQDVDWNEEPVPAQHHPSEQTMQTIIDMVDGVNGQKRRRFASIKQLYPWMYESYVERFRLHLNGTRRMRLKLLERNVNNTFTQARSRLQPVHGRMLKRWARQEAERLEIFPFSASDSWLKSFKRKYRIVSRKVTAYVGRSESAKAPLIAQRILEFGPNYTRKARFFRKDQIYNFDQTGFNYEPSNLRTLSHKGERDTQLYLDSRDKSTHSYTAQPMITRSGQLFPKLLLIMQEAQKGDFGPQVSDQVHALERAYGNIQVFATKSGKINSYLADKWYNTTVKDEIKRHQRRQLSNDEPACLFLADSWNGHFSAAHQGVLHSHGAETLAIPELTTDYLQPLDVNFNRQLKKFSNRITEEAFYNDILANVTSRAGILNVQSLMHNQLSSHAYRDMILYAWRHTDPEFNITELTNVPPKMVSDINFDFDGAAKCESPRCGEHAFIKCSHCGRLLCLKHFLERTCFHQPRVERSVDASASIVEDDATATDLMTTDSTTRVNHTDDVDRLMSRISLAADVIGGIAAAVRPDRNYDEEEQDPTRAPSNQYFQSPATQQPTRRQPPRARGRTKWAKLFGRGN